jgi:hypothetical protein
MVKFPLNSLSTQTGELHSLQIENKKGETIGFTLFQYNDKFGHYHPSQIGLK